LKNKSKKGVIEVILTNSQIQTWLNCRRYYKFNYIDLLKPAEESVALRIGSAVHEGLHGWYMTGEYKKSVARFYEKAIESILSVSDAIDVLSIDSEQQVVLAMMNGYCCYYTEEMFDLLDGVINVIDSEREIKTQVDEDVWFAGKIDLILEDESGQWLMESKTTSIIDDRYFEKLAIDPQVTGYTFLASKFFPDLRGIIYNVVRKPSIRQKKGETTEQFYERMREDYIKRPEFYFKREEIVRNEKEIEEFPKFVSNIAKELRFANFFPRSVSRCSLYGSCSFRPLCIEYSDELASTYGKKEKLHEELDTLF
jgi:hypothetical protein